MLEVLMGSLPAGTSCTGNPHVSLKPMQTPLGYARTYLSGQKAGSDSALLSKPISEHGVTQSVPTVIIGKTTTTADSDKKETSRDTVVSSPVPSEDSIKFHSATSTITSRPDSETIPDDEDDDFYDAEENHQWIEEYHARLADAATQHPTTQKDHWHFSAHDRETLVNEYPDLLQKFRQDGMDAEVISMMHPYGILELILEECPESGFALLKQRLLALANDVEKNWWGITSSKPEARKKLEALFQQLEAQDYDALLEGLLEFETQHGKAPFYHVLHECFVQNIITDPFKPESAGAYPPAEALTQSLQLKKMNSQKALEGLYFPPPGDWNNRAQLTETLTWRTPQIVHDLLLDRCSADINEARKKMRSGQWQSRQQLQLLSNRLKFITVMPCTPENLTDFIQNPSHGEVRDFLEIECRKLYFKQRYQHLMSTELSELSIEELNDIEQQVGYMLAMEGHEEVPADFSAAMVKQLKHFSHAIGLVRFMKLEQEEPLSERTFMLKPPATRHLMERLNSGKEDTEMKLYHAIDQYSDHLKAYHKNPSYSSIVAYQQKHHDLRLAQEEQVMAETRTLIEHPEMPPVMTPGTYQENLRLLKVMDQTLQETAPVRPVNSGKEAVMAVGYQVIWPGRKPLNDKLAELQHLKDLKAVGYSFKEELLKTCEAIPGASAGIVNRVSNIVQPAANQIQDWYSGKSSAWSILTGVQGSYAELERQASETLSGVLEIAQRNPRMFRRLVGDSAQTVEQLKILVGARNAGLVSQLQARLSAESAASYFAGDEAIIEEFDYANNPEQAALLKQFQFLLHVSDLALKGSVALNFFVDLSSNTAGSRLGNVIGLTAGTLIAGPAGGAVGWTVGGFVGAIATATANATGAIAIREGVNQLDGRAVRALNMLINYGPAFAYASSPMDELALIARGVAKKEGLARSVFNVCFNPIRFRYNRLTEAIRAYNNKEAGAFGRLAAEGAKCLIILGGSAAAGALVAGSTFYGGLLAVALWPIAASSFGFIATTLTAGNVISRLINYLDHTETLVHSAKDFYHYYQMLLPEGTDERARIEAHCMESSRRMMAKMTAQSPFKQYLRETITAEVANTYWDQWSQWRETEEDRQLVDSVNAGVEKEVSEFAEVRKELAEEILKHQKALMIFQSYKGRVDTLTRNRRAFNTFKRKLKEVGINPPEISRGIGYYIQDQLLEIPLAITRHCGTPNPGATQSAIEKTLEDTLRQTIRGHYLLKMAALGRPIKRVLEDDDTVSLRPLSRNDLLTIKNSVMSKLHNHLENDISSAALERLHLAVHTAAKSVEEDFGKRRRLSLDQVSTALANRLEEQGRTMEEVERLRVNRFQQQLKENPDFQNMTEEEQALIIDQAVMPLPGPEEEE
ncbi:hypothetical protein [Endozoicomonas arenosclerae]|uniref:hypothetical protein n=1 Tax=Endozoicomonas arenosclerae TaxID=1633495 RepID=UPI0007811652|nr:hypothetical protein [Endozoicomonas arenosclerae]